MCGIFGMVSLRGAPLRYPEALARMGDTIRHRGPDSSGSVSLPHAALGANRLRIVDMDPRADQPFTDLSICASLVFNGEIYNAAELRRQFPSYPFRSRSDAEVVLPLYREDGAKGLSRIEGMFALAIWDDARRQLILARDRAGEKPLFYAQTAHELLFASEVQALLSHPDVSRELDPAAVDDYLAFGYVREPRTMFAAVRKLPAGSTALWSNGQTTTEQRTQLTVPDPDRLTVRPSDRLLSLLTASVRRQLTADVPVGVFLSGGLDSSLIAALAAREGVRRTFTVRFTSASYDEGASAQRVARLIGTKHHEVLAGDTELAEAFETVGSAVAEPIADPAILPTYLLARSAREHVGVVLAGEGADELFGGYPAYIGHRLAPWVRGWLPLVARLLPNSGNAVPLSYLVRSLAEHAGKPWDARHVAWMGSGLDGARFAVRGSRGDQLPSSSRAPRTAHRAPDVVTAAMHFDYRTYLRDRLLPKIDRATMLASLEARAPYLDGAVTEFAFGLPTRFKVRGLTTKWILKQAASALLPRDIVHRRKRGLSVPISHLVNGPLRGRVDALLDPAGLSRQWLLNPDAASELLGRHRAGDFGVARGLWALVVLQVWMEKWS